MSSCISIDHTRLNVENIHVEVQRHQATFIRSQTAPKESKAGRTSRIVCLDTWPPS